MAKNDYRRQLIMLRGLEKGYGGHARLEKRVLSGTMDFVAASPGAEDVLEAAFVGNRGGKITVQTLGVLKNDGRGQKALLAPFDPRNISGMDLNEVKAAIISKDTNGYKEPVIYGCINGSCQLNWPEIRRALNEAYIQSAPSENTGNLAPEIEETIYIPTDPEKAHETSVSTSKNAPPDTASSRLNIDLTQPWPDNIESLRQLFMSLPVYEPFEMDGYVMIRAGLSEETGIDHCAVGVKAENGRITSVLYALPMPYTPEPPAGLEDYFWIGDTNSGWWATIEEINENA